MDSTSSIGFPVRVEKGQYYSGFNYYQYPKHPNPKVRARINPDLEIFKQLEQSKQKIREYMFLVNEKDFLIQLIAMRHHIAYQETEMEQLLYNSLTGNFLSQQMEQYPLSDNENQKRRVRETFFKDEFGGDKL